MASPTSDKGGNSTARNYSSRYQKAAAVYRDDEDETAGILWERTGYHSTMEAMSLSERSATRPERLTGFLRAVGITMLVCFFLASGNHYYHYHWRSEALLKGPARASFPRAVVVAPKTNNGTVLVTGAAGRLGSLLYKELRNRGETVRAFVRDVDKAKAVLGCEACDESEGIFVGDVTVPHDLKHAMADGSVTTLAVAIGVGYRSPPDVQRAVEFDSVVESVRTLALSSTGEKNDLGVVFCSSMASTKIFNSSAFADILHWKLNAEAFLATSGIATTIVKPCGLPESMAGNNSTLLVGHFDSIRDYHAVSREDVAAVMSEAVSTLRRNKENLRFDLCSKPGPPTNDLGALIESARWEWNRQDE
jgi:uncharacterized protein YbjT (DUF2867 family)